MPRPKGSGQIVRRKTTKDGRKQNYDYIPRIYIQGKYIDGPRCKDYEEAEVQLSLLLKSYGLEHTQGITLKAYCLSWLETNKQNVKWTSYRTYTISLNNQIFPHLGNIMMIDLKRTQVQNFINQELIAIRAKGQKGESTIRKAITLLHQIYEDYMMEVEDENPHLSLKNPVSRKRLKIPSEVTDVPQLWTEEQIWKFLYLTASHRLFPAIYTAITTGLRQGELLALVWSDLEQKTPTGSEKPIGAFRISKTLHQIPKRSHEEAMQRSDLKHIQGCFFTGTAKTIKSNDYVTIPSDTLELLNLHKQSQGKTEGYQDYNLIFPSTIGTPMESGNLLRDYYKLIEKAELPKIKWHDLRDTFASYSIAINDLVSVSKQLRHSNPSTTAKRYTHPLIQRRIKSAATANSLFPILDDFETTIINQYQRALKS